MNPNALVTHSFFVSFVGFCKPIFLSRLIGEFVLRDAERGADFRSRGHRHGGTAEVGDAAGIALDDAVRPEEEVCLGGGLWDGFLNLGWDRLSQLRW